MGVVKYVKLKSSGSKKKPQRRTNMSRWRKEDRETGYSKQSKKSQQYLEEIQGGNRELKDKIERNNKKGLLDVEGLYNKD